MLITVAAQRWHVDRNECRAKSGAVIHEDTGRTLRCGELAAAAAALPRMPATRIRLKNRANFQIVGKSVPSVDATAAKAMPGVRAVFAVPPIAFLPKLNININSAGGVAVVADST